MQQITEDNFIRTLKYNGFSRMEHDSTCKYKYSYCRKLLTIRCTNCIVNNQNWTVYHVTHLLDNGERNYMNCEFHSFEKFIKVLSLYIDLKPLPEFDFKQYLMDNGFEFKEAIRYNFDPSNILGRYDKLINFEIILYYYNEDKVWRNMATNKRIEPTKKNADILIQMAKLSGELK